MRRTKANAEAAAIAEDWLRWFWSVGAKVGVLDENGSLSMRSREVERRLSPKELQEVRRGLESLVPMLPEEVRQPARHGRAIVTRAAACQAVAVSQRVFLFVLLRDRARRDLPTRGRAYVGADLLPLKGELRVRVDDAGAISLVEATDVATELCRAVAEVIANSAHMYQVCRNPQCGRAFFKAGRQIWCTEKCRDRFNKANKRRPNRKRGEPLPPLRLFTDDDILAGRHFAPSTEGRGSLTP